ncbi:transposase [Marinobacter sp. UBA3607]|uniref:transposase n=1 Tax=Marinobacter sp. UBA3607 TaxID=1946820 RepID=UPI00257EF60B|nr:transposase [Marinobacter sp. UBA3607]
MPKARAELVSVSDTPFYHVISRCVRRTFLCGQDRATGRCYEHRRGWIEERIRLLASVFAVDVAAYAVMSNHYHLVVKLSPDEVEPWSMDGVLVEPEQPLQRATTGTAISSGRRVVCCRASASGGVLGNLPAAVGGFELVYEMPE